MALHWQWNEKCGEAVIGREPGGQYEEFTVSLYQGNAFLIMLCEWEDHGEKLWSMWNFFADRQHMKNCLGLNRKDGFTNNLFNDPRQTIKSIRINKKKYRYTKDLVAALAQAFDSITIELFSE